MAAHLVDAVATVSRQRRRLAIGEICGKKPTVSISFSGSRGARVHVREAAIGYSRGCEASVGRLQVDLRGSASSAAACPSVSLFRIIQLVLYRETKGEKEVMDDGKEELADGTL